MIPLSSFDRPADDTLGLGLALVLVLIPVLHLVTRLRQSLYNRLLHQCRLSRFKYFLPHIEADLLLVTIPPPLSTRTLGDADMSLLRLSCVLTNGAEAVQVHAPRSWCHPTRGAAGVDRPFTFPVQIVPNPS